MTCQQIITELEKVGNETTKRIFMKHGAKEPLFGVKVQDLKKILKKVKKNHELSLELYDTGISDARYLAGLLADETKITKSDLQHWADTADWYMLSEYTVPWVASETRHGLELALEWIEADRDGKAAGGWSTLANLATLQPDVALDIDIFKKLLQRVAVNMHSAPNRTRYAMNGFVIAVGCSVKPLSQNAMELGKKLGKISIEMGGTSCKVPYAPDFIQKAIDKGLVGKKKKMARC